MKFSHDEFNNSIISFEVKINSSVFGKSSMISKLFVELTT